MSEFELLDTAGDISGKLRLIYGSGPADPAPFDDDPTGALIWPLRKA